MICEICRDERFLAQKAEAATAYDLGTAQNLLDALIAHKDGCVGMTANMIGVCKRIKTFTGFTAEVIRHEIDHREGGASFKRKMLCTHGA